MNLSEEIHMNKIKWQEIIVILAAVAASAVVLAVIRHIF